MVATLADLRARASIRDLAQAASPDHCEVSAELLEATLDGADRSAEWTAEEIAWADAAVNRLSQYLGDADAEIKGWIGARYAGLDTPPAVLTTYSVDIALYRLYRPSDGDDPHMARYKAAIAWLRDVAQGKIDLPAPAPDPDVQAGVSVTSPQPVFSRDSLAGF